MFNGVDVVRIRRHPIKPRIFLCVFIVRYRLESSCQFFSCRNALEYFMCKNSFARTNTQRRKSMKPFEEVLALQRLFKRLSKSQKSKDGTIRSLFQLYVVLCAIFLLFCFQCWGPIVSQTKQKRYRLMCRFCFSLLKRKRGEPISQKFQNPCVSSLLILDFCFYFNENLYKPFLADFTVSELSHNLVLNSFRYLG